MLLRLLGREFGSALIDASGRRTPLAATDLTGLALGLLL